MTCEGSTRLAGNRKRGLVRCFEVRGVERFCSRCDLGVNCYEGRRRDLRLVRGPVFVVLRYSGGRARTPVAPSDKGNLRFCGGGLKGDALEPSLEFVQGKFTLQSVAFFAIADLSVEGG